MTRINGDISMQKSSDQLLINELGEITRPIRKIYEILSSGKEINLKNLPDKFTLNTGHERFFYNKLGFLLYRYMMLRDEYFKRFNKHYSTEHLSNVLYYYNGIPDSFKGIWISDIDANNIILDRIYERSKTYKRVHTYYGKPIIDWHKFLYS